MTKRLPKSWAMIAITGEGMDPFTVANRLEQEPDYYQTGDTPDVDDFPLIPYLQFNSKLSPDVSLEEHLWSLLKRLGRKRGELKEIAHDHEVSLYATVEFSDEGVEGIQLSPRLLLLLGDLGIRLEINPWQGEESPPTQRSLS